MPVSHIGLTVSHLPTSTSFFLAALQPLGYRFLGQWGNQIGLGVHEPDFFLTQETPGIKAGAAHIAFSAASRAAVREFYANALQAGGRPHGPPSARTEDGECFNAAVLDLDGNSVEVLFHDGDDCDDGASDAGKSRVLTWRGGVSPALGDNRSAVSIDTVTSMASSVAKKAMVAAGSPSGRSTKAPSIAGSAASAKSRPEALAIKRSFTAPTLTPQSSNDNIQISRKTLVGTILGAAAGAAVAYAMCKSEEDGAKAEHDVYLAASKHLQAAHSHLVDSPAGYSSPPRSVRNASEVEYREGYHPVRAIEAAPSAAQSAIYQHPSYTTVVTGHQESVASSRVSMPRSRTAPESQARSSIISTFVPENGGHENMPRSRKAPESQARSSVISSFVQDDGGREDYRSSHSRRGQSEYSDQHSLHSERSSPEPDQRSTHSHRKSSAGSSKSVAASSKSAAGSTKSASGSSKSTTGSSKSAAGASKSVAGSKVSNTSSKRSSRSKSRHRSDSHQSNLSAILESSPGPAKSTASRRSGGGGTSVLGRSVVPDSHSGSINYTPYDSSSSSEDNNTSDLDTVVPSDSVSQIGSSSSRRVRRTSEASSASTARRDDSRRASEDTSEKKKKKKRSSRSSEAGTESTMTPGKYSSSPGSAMTLPVRGITPSMIQGGSGQRSVVSYFG